MRTFCICRPKIASMSALLLSWVSSHILERYHNIENGPLRSKAWSQNLKAVRLAGRIWPWRMMTQPWVRSSALQHCSKELGMGLSLPGCMEPPPQRQRAGRSWPGSSAWLALSPRTLTLRCASGYPPLLWSVSNKAASSGWSLTLGIVDACHASASWAFSARLSSQRSSDRRGRLMQLARHAGK